MSLNEVGGDPRTSASRSPPSTPPTCAPAAPAALPAGDLHARQQARRGRARGSTCCPRCPAQWGDGLLRLSGWAELYRAHAQAAAARPQRHLAAVPDAGRPLAGLRRRRTTAARGPAPARAGLHAQGRARGQAEHQLGVPGRRLRGRGRALRRGVLAGGAQSLRRRTAEVRPRASRPSASATAWRSSLLKLTAPGVPDLYQGCEQWNFSLVDPDNRRPVDYAALARDLEAVQAVYRQGYPSGGTLAGAEPQRRRRPHQAAGHLAAAAPAAANAAPVPRRELPRAGGGRPAAPSTRSPSRASTNGKPCWWWWPGSPARCAAATTTAWGPELWQGTSVRCGAEGGVAPVPPLAQLAHRRARSDADRRGRGDGPAGAVPRRGRPAVRRAGGGSGGLHEDPVRHARMRTLREDRRAGRRQRRRCRRRSPAWATTCTC